MSVDHYLALAFLNPKELVAVVVDLFTDLAAWLDRHQYQLEVLSGVEYSTKIAVLLGALLNVRNETFHLRCLRSSAIYKRLSFGSWPADHQGVRHQLIGDLPGECRIDPSPHVDVGQLLALEPDFLAQPIAFACEIRLLDAPIVSSEFTRTPSTAADHQVVLKSSSQAQQFRQIELEPNPVLAQTVNAV
jgi:hypothetical protein